MGILHGDSRKIKKKNANYGKLVRGTCPRGNSGPLYTNPSKKLDKKHSFRYNEAPYTVRMGGGGGGETHF
jgi:hypothetical protein